MAHTMHQCWGEDTHGLLEAVGGTGNAAVFEIVDPEVVEDRNIGRVECLGVCQNIFVQTLAMLGGGLFV